MVGYTPGQVILGAVRNKAAQAVGSKPGGNASPWSRFQLLPPGSALSSPHNDER